MCSFLAKQMRCSLKCSKFYLLKAQSWLLKVRCDHVIVSRWKGKVSVFNYFAESFSPATQEYLTKFRFCTLCYGIENNLLMLNDMINHILRTNDSWRVIGPCQCHICLSPITNRCKGCSAGECTSGN